jgi:molecular chaperone GrpE
MAKNKRDNSKPEEELKAEEIQTEGEEKADNDEAAKQPKRDYDAELAAEKDRYLRLYAEYDNYRKRSQKEREALYGDIKAEIIAELLPVYDNLSRALAADCCDPAYQKGVQMTMNQLTAIFEKLGITAIETKEQPFNPELHNAVLHVEDEGLGQNVIVEEFQKGFKYKDKVIRCAMVKVAN